MVYSNEKAPDDHGPLQDVTPHAWDILLRARLVDPGVLPANQGYRVVDPAASLPKGNMPTKFAIHDSFVAGYDPEDGLSRNAIASASKKISISSKLNLSTAPRSKTKNRTEAGTSSNRRTMWSQAEELTLVQLRCQGVPYPVIARDHLGRQLRACQLKFSRLKTVPPYKDMWEKTKIKRRKDVEDSDDEDLDDDADDEDNSSGPKDYWDPDDSGKDHGQGGPDRKPLEYPIGSLSNKMGREQHENT